MKQELWSGCRCAVTLCFLFPIQKMIKFWVPSLSNRSMCMSVYQTAFAGWCCVAVQQKFIEGCQTILFLFLFFFAKALCVGTLAVSHWNQWEKCVFPRRAEVALNPGSSVWCRAKYSSPTLAFCRWKGCALLSVEATYRDSADFSGNIVFIRFISSMCLSHYQIQKSGLEFRSRKCLRA